MPKPTTPLPVPPNEIASLRAEVRALGSALGRVITRLEAPETFTTVEALRQLAKARRAGDEKAARGLAARISELSPTEAFNQAMAFTLYFELVNLAEENFRIMLLRQRRAARAVDRSRVAGGRMCRAGDRLAVVDRS